MADFLERHHRLRAVFDDALRVAPASRSAYLDRACDGDRELRAHVDRLLGAHNDLHSFLAHPIGTSAAQAAPVFGGTDRFAVIRERGRGGMGVVYEVQDQIRREVVALKTLRRASAIDLLRLKHEFRSLVDVAHHNLVCLYELVIEGEHSFFTMELVNGVNFVDYIRGDDQRPSIDRLVPALRQLVAGVTELHRHGKLHRDLKPSNVLVTADGRVVILDFGLIAESTALHDLDGAGTPAYRSPEDTNGASPAPASDWYAVGVTLYEALTGTLPFDGPVPDVIRSKRDTDPIAPASVAPDLVPQDLSDLCVGLLRRNRAERLTGADVLRWLPRPTRTTIADPARTPDALFVGREHQLAALRASRVAATHGAARSAVVYGHSGIGKSALVRQFIRELPRNDAVVLAGRCYENESVPYKALDGVVDDLSRYLAACPTDVVRALVPSDVASLTRLFPVLLQVEAIAATVRRSDRPLDSDPVRVRRLAIDALKTLLGRLARDRSLIVWIDDLQWADVDSMALLDELLATPPSMLTLLCFRQEEITAKPFLLTLVDRAGAAPGWLALPLAPMTDEEARRLIDGLAPGTACLSSSDKLALTREAAGSPFVLEQLCVHAGAGATRSLTVSGMLEARLSTLERQERAFLETLALCGRPVAVDVVSNACGVERDRQSIVVRLRASRLIRSSGSRDRVETYHDRIREAVTQRIPADAAQRIHGRMAASLVALGSDDCEALFEHYRGARDDERASEQAILAAAKTTATLAFDRAAFFYQQALTLTPAALLAAEWREALATALANAGRPPAAAEAYLEAAHDAPYPRRVELQRRAAEQFLVGGHIDRGLTLMRQLLAEVGLRGAESPRAAAAWVIARRARLRLRGLQFVARAAADVNPDTLLRLDTSWAVATGLALVDVVSASNFAAQHLHMALDAGEPSRIVRGAALEWSARNADWQFRRGSARFRALATTLAEELQTPQAAAMVALADSITAVATGQWRRGLTSSDRALTILREQCVGVTWEITIAQNIHLWSLMYLGELAEVSRRVPVVLDDARRRGNLYLATEVCTRSNFVWLAADDPDGGEREVNDAMANWSPHGFHRQHYSAMLARVQTALYRGDGQTAWMLFEAERGKLRQSLLTRVQALRVESLYLRARTAIAVAWSDPARREVLSVARRCADRIAGERMPWSDPLALLLHGCIASLERRPEDAAQLLEKAATLFEAEGMKLYLGITRRRLGAVLGDERGRAMQREAEAWMASQQIKNPVNLTRMLAPGFADAPLLR